MMQELNYILCGDYYIPDILLPEENRPIGRWGVCTKSVIRVLMRQNVQRFVLKNIDIN